MKRSQMQEENEYLKRAWYDFDKNEIIKHLNRTWYSIVHQAQKLKLHRSYDHRKNSDISSLLENKPDAFYQIGFILADGNISNNKRISIGISSKDKNHLLKFANFIKCGNIMDRSSTNITVVSAYDSEVVPKITSKFNLNSNKTYNPPDISIFEFIQCDLLISLIIGFIDGDGYITASKRKKSATIQITNHSSQIKILSLFMHHINKIIPNNSNTTARICKNGYASCYISSTKAKIIKQIAVKLELPILERK